MGRYYEPGGEGEEAYYNLGIVQGWACPVCEYLFGGDPKGLKKHMRQWHTPKQVKEGRKHAAEVVARLQRSKRGRKLLENV